MDDKCTFKTPLRALVIEDDPIQLEALVELLENSNSFERFEVKEVLKARNATSATKYLSENVSELGLILLDNQIPASPGMRPRELGLDIALKARQMGISCPIIINTGTATTASDEEKFLMNYKEVSEYVPKTKGYSVLRVRIEKQLLDYELSGKAPLDISGIIFHPDTQELVHSDEQREKLTRRESLLLQSLYFAHGKVKSVEVLNNEIWKNKSNVETQTIVQHITDLRRKLREKPRSPNILVFQDGGYCLSI
ncbi:MAG: winged helix-turn-helix domain-containing protein [Paracoccaceae bacterium]|nr:winged helix-turn-helix domain-containing protein [Paracoccaceae bacterium]MDE2675782.1 winged helix-turn-helix domain-containing protein [Paracoccaceae bacterium]MYJ87985.1 response regulator transcription factor [Paracoccaceae bacterium]